MFNLVGPDTSSSLVSSDAFLLFLKILFVLAAMFYVGFAFVVTRQIKIMKTTLITTISPTITFVGYLHLIFSVLVLIMFLLIL